MFYLKSPATCWLNRFSGIGVILCTLLALLSYVAWHPYLELTSHFKIQYLVISCIGLLGLLIWRSKRSLLVALFCLTLQLVEVLPWYLPPASFAAPPQPNLRILLSNIYFRNQNPEKLLQLIRNEQPDLVVIQEKTPQWIEWLSSIKTQLPFFFEALDDIAIYSRIPLIKPAIFGGVDQSSIGVTLRINGREIQVVATHPPPPKPALASARNTEFDWVANYVLQQKTPVILVGDLNTTMWSPNYKQLEQKTGLINARHGFGILPTWPAPTPYARNRLIRFVKPFLWVPIDHYLVSPEIKVRSLRSGTNIDSDHLPLIADLLIAKL